MISSHLDRQISALHAQVTDCYHDPPLKSSVLNVLANHGYLPRDGRNVTRWNFITTFMSTFNFGIDLATAEITSDFWTLKNPSDLDFHTLSQHNL